MYMFVEMVKNEDDKKCNCIQKSHKSCNFTAYVEPSNCNRIIPLFGNKRHSAAIHP